ncbi:ATP-binding protein [Psychrobacillus antarcticus]|uniref:ATP-binding protein n=1 Tax=Psychrobacillus antarcticus TaxID=2879115 RepID=UPI003BEEBAFF
MEEQTALTDRQLTQLQEFSCLEQQYNLILLGPPGFGKTFLAIGLGIEAIQRGFQVYFVTMGELIQLLKTQEFTHKSQVQIKRIQASDLVIIEDLMYMAMDQREANLFFQLVNHLYERSSIFFTSKKPRSVDRVNGRRRNYDRYFRSSITSCGRLFTWRAKLSHEKQAACILSKSVHFKRAKTVCFHLTVTIIRLM